MSIYFKLFVLLSSLPFWLSYAVANDIILVTFPDSSIDSENPEELVSLALKYEHAEGVPRNNAKAMALYCKAARTGDAEAQYSLGWMYANGRGVSRNDNIASHLFSMAAKQGHLHAQKMGLYTTTSSSPSLPTCLSKKLRQQTEGGEEVIYSNDSIFKLVTKLAPLYEVDPKLVMAIISVESGFNVRAVSPKNAQGLMQLIPETAKRFRVKNSFDAEDNIKGGIAYLQWLLAFFKGNVSLVAAAYNAGERAVERYRGIPPYPETKNYVKKIRKLYKKRIHPYRPSVVGR
ncbi:MAG: lytic transglycosylase [Betaproteobacteria bacterium]|nr:MAG: lytic transglycosylase [Betaproteobacteria bacterium]